MSDYIKREDAYSACCYETPECYMARKEIKALPSADVVPVVRCKNCKHWDSDYMLKGYGDDVHYCPVVDKRKHETGYCDEAEEKNNL